MKIKFAKLTFTHFLVSLSTRQPGASLLFVASGQQQLKLGGGVIVGGRSGVGDINVM